LGTLTVSWPLLRLCSKAIGLSKRVFRFSGLFGSLWKLLVWCVGTITPAMVDEEPKVLGLVATSWGAGKEAEVSEYGVPIVCKGEAEADLEDCMLGRAVEPL
jgi:hypothetical protein